MASRTSRTQPVRIAGCGRPPVRYAAEPEPAELLAGRYRLVEVVGRGATASVWRARDVLHRDVDRDVAVKQFREHAFAVAEARLAGRVRHPNVVAVHELVQQAGSSWLVMDYHGGTTLASLLRGGRRLPAPVVAALGRQLLGALRAVHAAGVVHGDVKPANLLVDAGRLVLTDFGISETVEDAAAGPAHPARREGDVVGSPAYLAPELVRGGAPQPAADLWSLGATLYAAVEGHVPFPHEDTGPTLAAVLHDPPAPTRHAGCLQPLLARLLDKDPARRPSHDAVAALLTEVGCARPTPWVQRGPSGGADARPVRCVGSVRRRAVPVPRRAHGR
jgi:serine/threonine protein kinase